MNSRVKHGWMVATVLGLSACGGGGGGSTTVGMTPGNNSGNGPSAQASGAGFWFGTHRLDGTTVDRAMYAQVTDEGDFIAIADLGGGTRSFIGNGFSDGASFSADAATYLNWIPSVDATVQGTIVGGVSITGSYSVPGQSSQFTLQYSNVYERSASLTKLQGVYSATGSSAPTTLVVEANGTVSGNVHPCTINGTITVPHANRNYYRVTGTASACGSLGGPMTGLIYLGDAAPGTDNLLVFQGQTDSHSTFLLFSGTK